MGDALELTKVSKLYEVGGSEVVALHQIDLAVADREVVTLLGPSGSGKTTLLSIAGGLLTPSTGRVVVGGHDITNASARKLTRFRRRYVGFIFQAVNLVPFLTARENLLVVAELTRRDRRKATRRADHLLEELGLSHRVDNLPGQLSGGEKQRVAIGRALMNEPTLVLVDEPTSALDSQLGEQVMELIVSEVKARDAAAVIVTHDQRMTRYGDRILTMADGRIASIQPRPEWTTHRADHYAEPISAELEAVGEEAAYAAGDPWPAEGGAVAYLSDPYRRGGGAGGAAAAGNGVGGAGGVGGARTGAGRAGGAGAGAGAGRVGAGGVGAGRVGGAGTGLGRGAGLYGGRAGRAAAGWGGFPPPTPPGGTSSVRGGGAGGDAAGRRTGSNDPGGASARAGTYDPRTGQSPTGGAGRSTGSQPATGPTARAGSGGSLGDGRTGTGSTPGATGYGAGAGRSGSRSGASGAGSGAGTTSSRSGGGKSDDEMEGFFGPQRRGRRWRRHQGGSATGSSSGTGTGRTGRGDRAADGSTDGEWGRFDDPSPPAGTEAVDAGWNGAAADASWNGDQAAGPAGWNGDQTGAATWNGNQWPHEDDSDEQVLEGADETLDRRRLDEPLETERWRYSGWPPSREQPAVDVGGHPPTGPIDVDPIEVRTGDMNRVDPVDVARAAIYQARTQETRAVRPGATRPPAADGGPPRRPNRPPATGAGQARQPSRDAGPPRRPGGPPPQRPARPGRPGGGSGPGSGSGGASPWAPAPAGQLGDLPPAPGSDDDAPSNRKRRRPK